MLELSGRAIARLEVVVHVEPCLKRKVKELTDFAYTLDGDMLDNGYILACQSQLKSDIVVEVDFNQEKLK